MVRRVSETEGALRMQRFEEVLLLPRLKRLYGQCVELNTDLAARTAQQSRSLTHVALVHSLAEAAGILDLLRTCPLLQSLRINWGDSTVGDVTIEWDEIGHALREHGSSLEVLDLDCRDCLSYTMDGCSGKIGPLRGLRLLQHLSLPQDILLGDEDLLSGLDHLGSSDDDEYDDGHGTRAEPARTVSLEPLLPNFLKSLHLYSCYEEEGWVSKCVQGLLSSQRLVSLCDIEIDGASELSLPLDETVWERVVTKTHLGFHRTEHAFI